MGFLFESIFVGFLLLGFSVSLPSLEEDYPGDEEASKATAVDTGPPPKIISKSMVIYASKGDNVTLPCEIINALRVDDTIIWTGASGQTLFVDDRPFLGGGDKFRLSNHDLIISDVQPSDSGNYTCHIPTPQELVIHTVRIADLVPAEIVEILPKGEKLALHKGDTANLFCNVSGIPTPVVTWTKVDMSGAKQIVSREHVLSLKNVSLKDSGVYQCSAFNKGNKDQPSTQSVVVTVYPKSTDFTLLADNSIVHATNEDYAILSCTLSGHQKAKVSWFKGNQKIPQNGHYETTMDGNKHVLKISAVKAEDFGEYTCVGTAGELTQKDSIKFIGVPTQPKINVLASSNRTASLTWILESGTKIMMYEVSYMRQQDKDNMKTVDVPYANTDEQRVYHVNYTFTGLPNGVYEAVVRVQNQYGWSPKSEPKVFTIDDTTIPGEEAKTDASSSIRSRFSVCLAFIAAIVFARHC